MPHDFTIWHCHMTSSYERGGSFESGETSVRLLEAAIEVIERAGEASVHVRDVAAAAGVSYSAVQFHFGGRSGLIDAAYLELYRRELFFMMAGFAERVSAATGPDHFAAAVREILTLFFRPERAGVRSHRAQILGAAAVRPALASSLAAVHRESFRVIADILDKPHRLGWLRPDLEPAAMIAVFLAITNGRLLVELGDTGVDLLDWDRAATAAVMAFLPETEPM